MALYLPAPFPEGIDRHYNIAPITRLRCWYKRSLPTLGLFSLPIFRRTRNIRAFGGELACLSPWTDNYPGRRLALGELIIVLVHH